MNQIFKRSAPFLALLGLVLGGCQPDISDDPKSSAGQADFSRYIAVGNSLTAGYSDNGVYREGQLNSYPAIMAEQFQKVGGGAFVQPVFPEANANGSGYLRITGFTAAGSPTIGQVTGNGFSMPGLPLLVRYSGTDNQNLGVPGIRVADITTADYGKLTSSSNAANFNPYFERLLSGTASTTYLQYVQERVATIKPTFFTNWLGNNDVLGFAGSGGTAAPLTPVTEFETKYAALTDALTANGAKGLVATIPNVTNVPLFTTVPTATVIAQIRATPIPAALEPAIKAALGVPQTSPLPPGLRFGFYIKTGAGTNRLATPGDLLLLTAQAAINVPSTNPMQPFPQGVGLELPGAPTATANALAAAANGLPSSFVLDADEVAAVQARTTALNAIIFANAQRKGLAVFDANAYFSAVARSGVVVNGVNNTAAFISGNLFSLDGVHPTPRGYAFVANEMIKAINAHYGAAVPGVDVTRYRGVKFP